MEDMENYGYTLFRTIPYFVRYRERGARRRYFASVIVSEGLAADILLRLS